MQATDSSMLKRRCRATEAMGLMATAIGKQAVTPMVPHIMQPALKVPSPPLHLSTYCTACSYRIVWFTSMLPNIPQAAFKMPLHLLQCLAVIYIQWCWSLTALNNCDNAYCHLVRLI
jgi:hypothetical protein